MADPTTKQTSEPLDETLEKQLHTHDAVHHALFDEDTSQVGSLGDIVEKHAGDAVFLTPPEKSVSGADAGYADWEAEMNQTDPAANEGMDPDDLYSAEDENGVFATDGTGTVEGIARGFGTHLPQDIGAGGFQVESLPGSARNTAARPSADGEELDDYDDDAVAEASPEAEPFAHMVSKDEGEDTEPTPGRIPVKARRPAAEDDALDATRQIN